MAIHHIHFKSPTHATRKQYIEMVILALLIIGAIGFVLWMQNGYTQNFLESF